jgi:uncharacterized protein YcnI
MIRITRAAMGATVIGLVAAGAMQSAAHADVSVDPNVAPRGGAAELTFRITEERPGANTTSVQLIPPTDTPIAEVYPMSVAGWAPITATKKLPKPVELIHGAQTTSIVTSVTWKRSTSAPEASEVLLTVSLGPMPETDRTTFTIVQTYSDGTVVRWGEGSSPGAVVNLVTAPEAAAGGHHSDSTQPQADAAEEVIAVEEESSGQPWLLWVLGGALLLGLAFAAEGFVLFEFDRRPQPTN